MGIGFIIIVSDGGFPSHEYWAAYAGLLGGRFEFVFESFDDFFIGSFVFAFDIEGLLPEGAGI